MPKQSKFTTFEPVRGVIRVETLDAVVAQIRHVDLPRV